MGLEENKESRGNEVAFASHWKKNSSNKKTPSRHRRHNVIIDDDSWDNLMLKVELDLRAETFLFISFLSALTSAIHPHFHHNLTQAPSIQDILIQAHKMGKTKPYYASLSSLFNAQEARRTERLRNRSLKGVIDEYDYMHDYFPQWRVNSTSKVSWANYADEFGGGCLNSVQFGEQTISSSWYGQIRARVDSIYECVDINIFRFVVKEGDIPDYFKDLESMKRPEVAEFIFHQLPKFETSRILRVSIPFDNICGVHLVTPPPESESTPSYCRYGVLVIDTSDSCQISTRRVNCSQSVLNQWRPRSDFTKGNQLTTRRFLLSGTVSALVHIVATLQACRPQFVYMAVHGIKDILSKRPKGPLVSPKEITDEPNCSITERLCSCKMSPHNSSCQKIPHPLSGKLNVNLFEADENEECEYISGVDDDDEIEWPTVSSQEEERRPQFGANENLMPTAWNNSCKDLVF